MKAAGVRRAAVLTGLSLILSACGRQPASTASPVQPLALSKSPKRGVAYDLTSSADLTALAPGVSWWYNWSPQPSSAVPPDDATRAGMDFMPMLWNGTFDDARIESQLKATPSVRYLLVLNEPNLTDQANMTPTQAADLWPRYERIAANTGVKLVGPAMNWGTMAGYADPVVWLDAFYSAYRSRNGRDPRIDYLAFHWYDYGLAGQLDRLKKYGKPFWVTEFSNWHSSNDGAQIDTLAKQKAQMADMVATLENRADVFRYAWFSGRWNNDTHFISLLGPTGQLTELGRYYLSLPFAGATAPGACGATNLAQGRPAAASSTEQAGTPASAAVDGQSATRWSSAWADPQWLQVDLGQVRALCRVTVQWEAAYGRAFELQVSNDAVTWTTVYRTSTGTGGTQTLDVSGSGRYVRVYGTQRGTGYGYSLFELQVFAIP